MVNAFQYTNGMQTGGPVKCPEHNGTPADFEITQEQVGGSFGRAAPPHTPTDVLPSFARSVVWVPYTRMPRDANHL